MITEKSEQAVPAPLPIKDRLQNLLIKSCEVDFTGNPNHHPLVVINAAKNILSDDKDGKHDVILGHFENWLQSLPPLVDSHELLNSVRKKAKGKSIFVGDFIDAIQEGNGLKAGELAAQIHLSAQNPTLVQECLTEVYLQNVDYYGTFCYHWLRVNHFVASDKQIWKISSAGLSHIDKIKFPGPSLPGKMPELQPVINSVLNSDDRGQWITLAAVIRLLEQDYIRSPRFNNEISFWLRNLKLPSKKIIKENEINADLVEFRKNGSDFFVKLLINRIEKQNSDLNFILELEAFRTFARLSDENGLPIIASRLKEWID